MDAVGMFFWNARGGRSFAEVAKLLGADSDRQVRTTMAWLSRIEQYGLCEGDEEFLPELLRVLEADARELQMVLDRKRRQIVEEFEAWAAVKEPITLYWWPMPAIALPVDLGHLTEDEALEYASKFARGATWNVLLKLDRVRSVWFEGGTGRELRRAEETPFTSHLPYLRVGNKTVETLFSPAPGGRA